jgi:GAF domain-containing protein
LSLPLIIGERVLGTLNFASVSPQAYSLENAPQLEQIAGQVAVALENQRLAQAQQKSLQEMEALTRQLTGQAWAKRRQRQATESVQYARSGIDTDLPASTPEIEAAIEIQQPIVRSDLDNSDNHSLYQAALAVPIVLRGEVLGGLQVSEAGQAREWTEDDLTFLQAVADQVALALDNARLIEEAERRAERERLVADISTRMFAANDLESILQIAGDELGRGCESSKLLSKCDLNWPPL